MDLGAWTRHGLLPDATPSAVPAAANVAAVARPPAAAHIVRRRAMLAGGSLAAVVLVLALTSPVSMPGAEPSLVLLLRGMAAIKAILALGATGLLAWRFGAPVCGPLTAAYLGGAWLMAGASALLWHGTFIPVAATTYHVGAALLIGAAWRDRPRTRCGGPHAG